MFHIFCAFSFTFFIILPAEGLSKPGCLEKDEALSLLKTAEDFLSKANDAYPSCNQTECGGNLPIVYMGISKKLISDVRGNFPKCPKAKIHEDKPSDCSEILASGYNESGVYSIWPSESCKTGKELQVYCDMETDYGGWTLIQRRGRFQVQQDFYQDWTNYKNGFGNITEEFWLGNENIRVLCHKGCEIRFDVQAKNGSNGFAAYKNFNLTRSSYTLYISDYNGNIGDSMIKHNGYAFTTYDKGRTSEANLHKGGWWYCGDYSTNLNGIYLLEKGSWSGAFWISWRNAETLFNVEIKVRPK